MKTTSPNDTMWRALCPPPCSRGFIVGSVGSGKSTVGGGILEAYHRFFASHRLFIVDPKHRFFAQKTNTHLLFPSGVTSSNHGRRDGVTVNATLLKGVGKLGRYSIPDSGTFVIQDTEDCLEFFDWILKHHDVRKPVLIYLDESFDFMRGVRAYPLLRKIIQMGREMGIGILIVNQRPSYVDATFISESERLYVGTLHNVNDRKKLADTVAIPNAQDLLIPMPKHTFWLINQAKPESSFQFRLTKAA